MKNYQELNFNSKRIILYFDFWRSNLIVLLLNIEEAIRLNLFDYLISHSSSANASLGRPRNVSRILLPVIGIIEIPTSFVLPLF